MSVKKYRKKPVEVEAIQLNVHNVREVAKWCGADLGHTYGSTEPDALDIHTLEGTMVAHIGDYIIRGVQGEFYPCNPDIFAATYEDVQSDEETVDAVAISLHRHHEARRKGPWPNMWTKYDDLDAPCRNEYRDRAEEIITAIQGTATVDKAAMYLATLWCPHGPARAKFAKYARERITETLSDVPTLKETK